MKTILLILSTMFALTSNAQQITGVIANYDNKPLEEATVLKLYTSVHAHTNELGYFELKETKVGDTIKVSRIGYKQQIIVCKEAYLNIMLESANFQLSEIAITSNVSHLNTIATIDLLTNPVQSSQDLLRKVPGLFIGQHAGGGKAEQIFLRGFDIDHGTDINVSVDDIPVNMVSHAHGQGYADLHFLIPETVAAIDFDKGPYNATKGNLATAGYVAFKTKERLDSSTIALELGQFNTLHTTALLNLVNNAKHSAYFAADYLLSDSYFESSQNFKRTNLFGKYTAYLPNDDKLSLSFSHFTSKWNASGQIPSRAVAAGIISRFGSIDNTEGGNTGRTSLNLAFNKKIDAHTFIKTTAFYSLYNFELYSNFTFFLNDSLNGDQIRQKEQRNLFGFTSAYHKDLFFGKNSTHLEAAVGMRNDVMTNTELSHTANRVNTLQQLQLGDIDETNLFAYANAEIKIGKLLINPALRLDEIKFNYTDKLAAKFATIQRYKPILSPKLNFLYQESKQLQFFIKMGKGFHSNDARVVTSSETTDILPAAYGADAGFVYKPFPYLILNSALWYLFSEQEFVYVGDAGIVELSGKTERRGIDVGARFQFATYFFANADCTFNSAKSLTAEKGLDYIPLAPISTFTGGLSFIHQSGITASIKTRFIGDRPANEDNSLVAKGYIVTDANASYNFKKGVSLGVIIQNIFNETWKETQFATESRLRNEPQSVTEIHYTPGTPFNLKIRLSYSF